MKLFPIAPAASLPEGGRSGSRWRTVLGEPLLHFLVVGAALFGAYHVLNPAPEGGAEPQQIVLTRDDVRRLAISWLAQGRSPPTPEQVRALVDQKVTQEILFREAVALGLDRDDEVVKRRLAQKMDFLAADVATLQEPTEEQLKAWFSRNSVRFTLPAHASFRHLYFSPDRHGAGTRDAASAALARLAGKTADPPEIAAAGDPFMFQNQYQDVTPEQAGKQFGPQFSDALFQLAPGTWHGPVQSGYGWHLVWIDSVEPGRVPTFAEVKPNVKAGWIDDQYREIKRAALDDMRSRYVVTLPVIDPGDWQDLQLPARAEAALEVSAQ